MRKYKLLILTILMILPISVNAHSLKCDSGTYNYNDKFMCYLHVDAGDYKTVNGILVSSSNNVTCSFKQGNPNLTFTKNTTDFNFSGVTSNTTPAASYECTVIGKSTEGEQVQISIPSYKYEVNSEEIYTNELVLRSDYLTLAPHIEVEEPDKDKDEKPRDISNAASTLKSVSDENVPFNFSRIRTEYEIEVLYEVEKLNLVVYPFDINATYKIEGDQNLKVGENIIDIYVTSPDGTSTTCYTFNFKRLARGVQIYYPDEDASLTNLSVQQYHFKYDKNIKEYTVKVDHTVNELNITATPTVAQATYEIKNNVDIKNGTKIDIVVTSVDQHHTETYTITVIKSAPPVDHTKEIVIGILAILAIVVVVIIINTGKKEKNDDILKLKHDKRRVKKGKNFDVNDVPEAAPTAQEANKVVSAEAANKVILEQVTAALPIHTDAPVESNLNKVTPVQATISLNTTEQAAPIAVTEPVVVENTVVSGLGNSAPTLDLSQTNVQAAVIQPVQEIYPTQQVQEVQPQQVVITQPVTQEPTVQVASEPMVEQMIQEPIAQTEQPMVQPIIQEQIVTEQQTSVIPVTPTAYALPQDQNLMQQELPQIEELPPIIDPNNQN